MCSVFFKLTFFSPNYEGVHVLCRTSVRYRLKNKTEARSRTACLSVFLLHIVLRTPFIFPCHYSSKPYSHLSGPHKFPPCG